MSELMSVSELISYSRSLTDEHCGRGSTEIRHTAKQAAADWLNDAAKGFMPGNDPNPAGSDGVCVRT